MLLSAKEAGYYRKDLFGTKYDKIQILSVEDILDNININYPNTTIDVFRTAQQIKSKDDTQQGKLDLI